jgi:hypothetical protein
MNPIYTFPDGHEIEVPFLTGFSPNQEKLMEELWEWWEEVKNKTSSSNIFLVKGFAGVGKTSVIKFFLQYLIETKKIPKGFAISAPSHQARKQLFKSIRNMQVRGKFGKNLVNYILPEHSRDFFKNRTFTTQAAFQVQLVLNEKGGMEYRKEGEELTGYSKLIKQGVPAVSLWVIDEVSMISDPDEINKIVAYSQYIPIIIMGDPAQLRNPGTQKLSPLFSSPHVRHSLGLKEVMRTGKGNPLIEELTKVRTNIRSAETPLSYKTQVGEDGNGIIYIKNGLEKIRELFTHWKYSQSRSFVKIVAKSNDKVSQYNKLVRGILNLDGGEFAYAPGDTLMGYTQPVEIFYNSQEYIVETIKVEEVLLTDMLKTTLKNGARANLDDYTMTTLTTGRSAIESILKEINQTDLKLIPYTVEVIESDSIFKPMKSVMYIFDMHDQDHVREFDKTGLLFNILYKRIEELREKQKEIPFAKRKQFWKEKILPIDSAMKILSATLQTNENIYRYGERLVCEPEIERNVKIKLADKDLPYEKIREYIDLTKRKVSLFKEKSIDYGYAITAYKSQGATYENTIIDLQNIEGKDHYWRKRLRDSDDGIQNLNSEIYVAMSRSAKSTYALTHYAQEDGKEPNNAGQPGGDI